MSPNGNLQHSHINIDGVVVPIQQAVDGAAQGVAASVDAYNHMATALVNGIGPVMAGAQNQCDYLRKMLRKYLKQLDNYTGGAQQNIINTLGLYTGTALDQSAAAQQLMTSGLTTGSAPPPTGLLPGAPTPPPASVPPPVGGGGSAPFRFYVYYHCNTVLADGRSVPPDMRVGIDPPGAVAPWTQTAAGPFSSWNEADAWLIDHRAAFLAQQCDNAVNLGGNPNLPPLGLPTGGGGARAVVGGGANVNAPCPPGSYPIIYPDGHGGRCGTITIQYQCAGTDGRPAWTLYIVWADGGANPAGVSSPNYNVNAGNTSSQPWTDGSVSAAAAYAAQHAATVCAGGQPPPPPTPPPPVPSPPPIPVPQPPPQQCPPPVVCQPCPSPLPPSPPAPTPPGACPVFPTPQPSLDFDLCTRWPLFVQQIVDAGKAMRDLLGNGSGYAVTVGYITNIFKCIDWTPTDPPSDFWALLTQSYNCEGMCDIVGTWQLSLKDYICDASDDVTAAVVFRAALEWWANLDISAGADMSGASGLVVGAGVGTAGIDIGTSEKSGKSEALGLRTSIKPVIVPLIQLVDRVIAWLCPIELPSSGEAIESFIRNQITEETLKCLLRLHGLSWELMSPVVYSRRQMLTVPENIQLGRRHGATDTEISDSLRYYGWLRKDERDARVELYDQLPNVSDVLHFLQRNVFDAKYVADFGLMDGYDERFAPRYEAGLRALGMQLQTIKDHYAAHWINPSIGQLFEMVQRLRPRRVDDAVQFTTTDALRVLAEQDVAPYFRARLLAISYRTLPLRQLTQLVIARQITQDELAQRWQDIGYKEADAKLLAQAMMYQANRQRATQFHQYTPAAVAKLWPARQITRQEAYDALAPQGLSQADVDTLLEVADREFATAQYTKHTLASLSSYAKLAAKAYGDGVVSQEDAVSALVKAGFSQEAAQIEIGTVDLSVRVSKITDAVRAVKKAFLYGEVTSDQAATALVLAGVLQERAVDYVQRWSLLLTVPRKVVSGGQIKRWAVEGIISIQSAEMRLLNLGYSPDAVALEMIEIAQTIRAAEQRAAALKARELEKAQADADRAQKAIQRQYCRLYTPGKMKLWYSERIIDESTYRDRLRKCGYSDEAIDSAFKEAEVARARKDEQSRKNGAVGIEYTGPGADAGP